MIKRRSNQSAFALNTALLLATLMLLPRTCDAYVDPNVGGRLAELLVPMYIALAAGWALMKGRVSARIAAVVKRTRGRSHE